MIVADTNAISYLLIEGTHTASAEAAFRKDPEWAAPLLWRSEFRNVLSLYLRSKHLSVTQACALMQAAETLMQGREYQVSSDPVLGLAANSGCSAYDCEFVALAQDLSLRLLTSDKGILKAFPETAVALREFAE